MEESRGGGGGEVRKIHIVYFLSDNGKVDQPHLIKVNRLNHHGVRLRDVKRWLSQTRGQDMPESFAWSYKRSYRGGYVWQDLIDNDLITAVSDNEYVLKGSLLPSHTKTMDPFLDGEKPPIKNQAEKREQLKMDENKLSSEEMNSKDEFFRIGSIWLKETNSEEEDSSVTVVNKKLKKKKKIGSDLIKRNFIGCMTVETKGSAHRVAQTEDSSVSGSSQGSNSSKSSRSCSINREKPATKGKGSVSEASRRSTGSSLL